MANYKVLVVDDEINNLKIHVNFLIESENQYEIMQANSGKLALEIIAKRKPDLVLLDWEMPGISGIDVVLEIQKNEETKDIAVIIITGTMTSSENLKKALDLGAVDFMRKPVEELEFNARVKSMLRFIENSRAKLISELELNALLKDKIDFKNRELVNNVLLKAKQNAEILKIIEDLELNIHVCTSKTLKSIIIKTIESLKLNINNNVWNDFKMRFEKTHPDFIRNLREKNPKLSSTEQKLSVLLRLNFSSKEIADILFIQIGSVKTARSRLRKKFNLQRDTNIIVYLSQF